MTAYDLWKWQFVNPENIIGIYDVTALRSSLFELLVVIILKPQLVHKATHQARTQFLSFFKAY